MSNATTKKLSLRKILFLQAIWLGLIMIMVFGLSSCGNQAPIQWVKKQNQAHGPRNGIHVVQNGESLFGVCFRYGYDYLEVARLNNIPAPYVIKVGQKLYFSPKKSEPIKQNQVSQASKAKPHTPSKTLGLFNFGGFGSNSSNSSNDKIEAAKNNFIASWPLRGKIVRKFDGNQNKGIDIANKIGSPIAACEEGTVMYSGNGLKDYGNLIIIKHSNDYMSTYAHNQTLNVREGDKVHKGQIIATMGEQAILHFEIRYKGEPIEPTRHLRR
ncbi:MAG: peptidoglycan DD-metalloendopeptidase family protein [Gammaproteobacteria bacterium]